MLCLGALLVATGCATARPPAGTPVEVPRSTADVGARVPAPPMPKDARGLLACEVLRPDELVSLGLDPQTADRIGSGKSQGCLWKRLDGMRGLGGLSIFTDLPAPAMLGEYDSADLAAVFEPTEVAGHPAVRSDLVAGQPCRLVVAVARYQSLVVSGALPDAADGLPCSSATRMAELVLSNLPPLTRSER